MSKTFPFFQSCVTRAAASHGFTSRPLGLKFSTFLSGDRCPALRRDVLRRIQTRATGEAVSVALVHLTRAFVKIQSKSKVTVAPKLKKTE